MPALLIRIQILVVPIGAFSDGHFFYTQRSLICSATNRSGIVRLTGKSFSIAANIEFFLKS
jgi:hypothetical protein